MATLPGQRAQFTWALNQYNVAEDEERRAYFARRMAKYIADASVNGFTVEQITQGQLYPVAEVAQYVASAGTDPDDLESVSEGTAIQAIQAAVDTTGVLRLGSGSNAVYAYGYRCCPDRLKIGLTEGDPAQRIAAQISTGTPDQPVLFLEIKTHDCSSLERAIHATLNYRGAKILGGGKEWFKTTREEIVTIYEAVAAKPHDI